MVMIQMNTRIDENVKAKGDAVFAQLGMTTTDVVRAVWGYAAEHADAPGIVAATFAASANDMRDIERRYRMESAEDARNIVAHFRESLGLGASDRLDEPDYDELRASAWRDRMVERGLA